MPSSFNKGKDDVFHVGVLYGEFTYASFTRLSLLGASLAMKGAIGAIPVTGRVMFAPDIGSTSKLFPI